MFRLKVGDFNGFSSTGNSLFVAVRGALRVKAAPWAGGLALSLGGEAPALQLISCEQPL